MTLPSEAKVKERGCVVLDQPQQMEIIRGHGSIHCRLSNQPAAAGLCHSRAPFSGRRLAAFAAGDVFEHAHDEGGPAGLVGGAESAAGFGVEEFVEQDEIAPVGIVGPARVFPVTGAVALGGAEEQPGEARFDFARDLLEVHQPAGAGGAFDLEAVAVEMVVAFERRDEVVVRREPDRAALVGIAAEEPGV